MRSTRLGSPQSRIVVAIWSGRTWRWKIEPSLLMISSEAGIVRIVLFFRQNDIRTKFFSLHTPRYICDVSWRNKDRTFFRLWLKTVGSALVLF